MSSPTPPASSSENKSVDNSCCCSRITPRLGWIVAATMTFLVILLTARVATFNTEVTLLQQEIELARLETQGLKQQLEAERILNARQLADLASKQKTGNTTPAAP